jgi:hypothetical protein
MMNASPDTLHALRTTLLLVALCMLLVTPVLAQPALDAAWLTVQVMDGAGNPVTGTIKATLTPVDTRLPTNERPTVVPGGIEFVNISDGEYILRIMLTTKMTVTNALQLVTIEPGANLLEWRIGTTMSVTGALTLADIPGTPEQAAAPPTPVVEPAPADQPDEAPGPLPTKAQSVLLVRDKAGKAAERRLTVTPTFTPGRWTIAGLAPGSYRLLLLTELGYATTTFAIKDGDTTVDGGTLALQPGTTITLNIHNADITPAAGAKVTLKSLPLAHTAPADTLTDLESVLTLAATADENGVVTFLSVPPCSWRWVAKPPATTARATGLLTTAGQPLELNIFLPVVKGG